VREIIPEVLTSLGYLVAPYIVYKSHLTKRGLPTGKTPSTETT